MDQDHADEREKLKKLMKDRLAKVSPVVTSSIQTASLSINDCIFRPFITLKQCKMFQSGFSEMIMEMTLLSIALVLILVVGLLLYCRCRFTWGTKLLRR